MNHLIIGAGEIGKSLFNVFTKEYEVWIRDKGETVVDGISVSPAVVDVLHVAFPYSRVPEFVDEVERYQKQYDPKYTIIHSTVPPGTSRGLGAIHSPVLGIHPHLEQSLKIFTKFLGGEQASEVADIFRKVGIKVYVFDKSETTELMKILDTTFYGLCIEYTKEAKRIADEYRVPFEAWKIWTDNYNHGYQVLGYPEFTRPNLIPLMKKIGGHCVLPNADMLDSAFARLIKDLNKKYEEK